MLEGAADGGTDRQWRRPEWLPEGWAMEMKLRNDGRSDKYFVNPKKTHVFRSKADVSYYLKSGEIRRGVLKWNPGSFKPSRELPTSRKLNNQGNSVRRSLFVYPTSTCEEKEEAAEPLPEKTHLQNYGGCDPVADLSNSGITKSLMDHTNKTSKYQYSLSDGNSESTLDTEPEQMAGKSREESASAQTKPLRLFALKHLKNPIEPSIVNWNGSTTSKPVKKRLPSTVPVRRSLRNKGGNANLSSEAELAPSQPSQIMLLAPNVMNYGLLADSTQVTGKSNKADKKPSKLKDVELTWMEFKIQNKAVDTHQDHSLLGKTCATNEKPNSPKDKHLGSEPIGRMGMETQTNDAFLRPSDLESGMVSSNILGISVDATRPANNKEHEQQERVLGMINEHLRNVDINVKGEGSVRIEANAGVIKQAMDKLPNFGKQLVAITGDCPSLAAHTSTEKATNISSQSQVRQSNKSKIYVGPDVETDNDWSLKKIKPGMVVSGDSPTPIDLDSQPIISNGDLTNTKEILMPGLPAPSSWKIVDEKEPLECKTHESRTCPFPAEGEQKSLDSSVSFPFGDAWPDPCIEFAFKTLTGDLPIFEDNIAIENFFHQHLALAKNQRQTSMPPFTVNFNFMLPETATRFEDKGMFKANAGRTNQEHTMKNGLQSTELKGRLKRAKMN